MNKWDYDRASIEVVVINCNEDFTLCQNLVHNATLCKALHVLRVEKSGEMRHTAVKYSEVIDEPAGQNI
jgi:hypothetical protein